MAGTMRFYLNKGDSPQEFEYPCFILQQDNWDDFGHQTLFQLNYSKNKNSLVEIGIVKILSLENSEIGGKTVLPKSFEKLDRKKFLSIGQNIKYYRRLSKISTHSKNTILSVLTSLCDALFIKDKDDERFDSHGWQMSLQRNDSAKNAFKYGGFYAGLPHDNIVPPRLSLVLNQDNDKESVEIEVSFEKHKRLPNRIFAIIGSNGTGKTTVLSRIPYLITKGLGKYKEQLGLNLKNLSKSNFSRVIAVSYNQYDSFAIPKESDNADIFSDEVFNYKYCGVRQIVENQMIREINRIAKEQDNAKKLIKLISAKLSTKDNLFQEALTRKIQDSIKAIKQDDREDMLENVLNKLLPKSAVTHLFKSDEFGLPFSGIDTFLSMLSAGQKILATTVIDLIAFMEQGSLLLIDEPESNLHPGTISTFAAVLHDLLAEFDSFAIIASHSPILLQQVPSKYTCLLKRNDAGLSAKKIKFETFGEDLGTLTERAFGLSEPEQDFRSQIDDWLNTGMKPSEILEMFSNRLGESAESYLISREDEYEKD